MYDMRIWSYSNVNLHAISNKYYYIFWFVTVSTDPWLESEDSSERIIFEGGPDQFPFRTP